MTYKRIFTFGCSFTNWFWPTWPDIIAIQSGIPVYNGALVGIGNVGILYRMVEYDLKYNFDKDDLILVMWTGWSREDRYLNNQWTQCGNIFNNDFYDAKFIKRFWSWENDIIKNSSSIILANKSFQIGENYSAFKYTDVEVGKEVRYETDIQKLYVDKLPQPVKFNFGKNYKFNNKCLDGHPDILSNVNFYNEHIADKFNFSKVSQESCFHQWQQHIETTLPQTTADKQLSYIDEYFKNLKHSFSKT